MHKNPRYALATKQDLVKLKEELAFLNSYLKLSLSPSPDEEVFISKSKSAAFKSWLES